jgi:hypothetical protein
MRSAPRRCKSFCGSARVKSSAVGPGALTFNQRVVGSIPTALTNKTKQLGKSLLPRTHDWEAHGNQNNKRQAARSSRHDPHRHLASRLRRDRRSAACLAEWDSRRSLTGRAGAQFSSRRRSIHWRPCAGPSESYRDVILRLVVAARTSANLQRIPSGRRFKRSPASWDGWSVLAGAKSERVAPVSTRDARTLSCYDYVGVNERKYLGKLVDVQRGASDGSQPVTGLTSPLRLA